MPEGDTIHRLAAKVRPGLQGHAVVELHQRDRGRVTVVDGAPIGEISALGKNLLVRIGERWVVRVHLGLKGAARTRHPSDDWRGLVRGADLTLATDALVLAIFRSRHARLQRRDDPLLERVLSRLGPDLLAPSVDWRVVLTRARLPGHARLRLSDLLLDQGITCGIGNVYKSEALFLEGVHPYTRTADLPDAQLLALFQRARELMLSNLGPGGRATVGPLRGARRQPGTPSLFVYGRRGLPCLRCRTPIERDIQGDQARATFWCPRCQPPPPGR